MSILFNKEQNKAQKSELEQAERTVQPPAEHGEWRNVLCLCFMVFLQDAVIKQPNHRYLPSFSLFLSAVISVFFRGAAVPLG